LTGFGPLPVPAIARALALPASTVAAALVRLESEGYVMRGRFSAGAAQEQWCERHLLARIHRYTVRRLRREIEPVERADFMRFLFQWQHLTPDTRGEGRDALAAIVDQLEGFEAAASAWEEEILPARLKDYSVTAIDELCRSGKVVWTRLGGRLSVRPAQHGASTPVRTTPIVLLPRRELAAWHALGDPSIEPELSARAQRVHDALTLHGAMFFDELLGDTHLLRVELETALGELVAAGLVNADSFAGLRALLTPAATRQSARRRAGRHLRGALIGGMDDAGRWALVRRPARGESGSGTENEAEKNAGGATLRHGISASHAAEPEVLEHIAMTLLRRYGVVCWLLLEREAAWLPRWRDLLRVLQRLEARGEVRGGRFVNGISGEQFALPEAIPVLREVRKQRQSGTSQTQMVCVCGADPLNLVGTILPGDKIPALAGNRVLFRDGVPIATLIAGKFEYSTELDALAKEDARLRLARRY
ncbi:MAG TPA: ATP-dependent DNA helicase, partial [Trinickia sp.]|nr:ATP-dependent DNA helicase [Trinickia sp.]